MNALEPDRDFELALEQVTEPAAGVADERRMRLDDHAFETVAQ